MRIAYCITELAPGGAERALVELATRLDRAQFEPVVYVLADRPPAPRDALVRRLEAAGIPVTFLAARRSWQFAGTVRRLAKALAEQRPDIVHSYLFHANIVARFAARKAKVGPVFCGIRVAERRAAWHRWLDRRSQRLVSRYLCVSQSVADFSREVTGLPAEKLTVIPNGIDVDALAARPERTAAELGLPAGRRFIACVGRLDRQKGINYLLRVVDVLLQRVPEHDLVLVGDGPLRQFTEMFARQFVGRIHVLGWRSDAVDYIHAADVLLLPSLWEGMPNVVLEAMALARPVIATDVEGVRELLAPNDTLQVVPKIAAPNLEPFLEPLVTLLRSPERCRMLGDANQARAREGFNFARLTALHEALYRGATRA